MSSLSKTPAASRGKELGSVADGAAHRFAQATLDALPDHVCVLDQEGEVIAVNRAWRAFAEANGAKVAGGYLCTSYLGVCERASGPGSEQAGPFRAGLLEVLAGRSETFTLEYPCHSPTEERWFLARATRFDEGGQARLVVSHTDITTRMVAEARVRESEAHLRLAVRGGDLGTWDWEVPTGRLTFNDRWAQMLGYRLDEIEPHVSSWERLVHPDDMPRVRPLLDAHLRGETASYASEHRLRHKDGHWVWVFDCGVVVARDADGAPLRAAGTHHDISRRKRAEAEWVELQARTARAERGAALGTLAAGMAHEINNPLTPVLAGIDFAKAQLRSLDEPGLVAWRASGDGSLVEVQEALEDASNGARRVRDLVADLRAFALGQHAAGAQCDLPSALTRAARVARHALTEGTELTVELPPLPSVSGSEAELAQLFAGLLVNAGQARGERTNQVRVTAERRGRQVVVRISDTGVGIRPEDLPRVFDPFFTTRSVGKGKGLGLTVAQGIAAGLGGHVEVESEKGEGTVVTVTLPVGVSP